MSRAAKRRSSAKIKQTYESEKVAKRAPEAHIPTGHYVMFEKEDQTLKGNPGFNRYCYFARINFKPGNGYLDETLEIPLTKANSYIGQVIYYRFVYSECIDEKLDADIPADLLTKNSSSMSNRYRRGITVALGSIPKEQVTKAENGEVKDEWIEENDKPESGMTVKDDRLTKSDITMLKDLFNMPDDAHNVMRHKILRKHLQQKSNTIMADTEWSNILDQVEY